MLWTRAFLTTLACTQLSLVAMQRYRAPLSPSPFKSEPEGISLVVDRIANSKYGLLQPLPGGRSQPVIQATPLSQILKAEPHSAELPRWEPTEVAPPWMWPMLEQQARSRGLDPVLVESVVRMESGFRPDAVSPAGAVGLMQLMPETAELVGVSDSFDPQQNLAGGSEYLSWQVRDFGGDLSLALAAYNAGPAAVRRWGGIPPYGETTHYVRGVLEDYRRKLQTAPSQSLLGEMQDDSR